MKHLFLVFFLFFLTGFSWAASTIFETQVNGTGDWNNGSVWSGGISPGNTIGNGDDVIVAAVSNVTLDDTLYLGNVNELVIYGKLTINGNISVSHNNPKIIVKEGGELVIKGMFNAKNNVSVMVDGSISVTKDIVTKNNITLTIDGTGMIKGNVDLKGGANVTFDGQVDVYGYVKADQNASVTVGSTPALAGTATLNVYGSNTVTDAGGTGDFGIIGTKNNNSLNGYGMINLTTRTDPSDPYKRGIYGFTVDPNLQLSHIALPVKLVSFIAELTPDGVHLKWKTESEKNNDFFRLSRSENAEEWTDIAHIAGSGTTSTGNSYSYLDKNALQKTYYQLRQVDFDGTTEVIGLICISNQKEKINIKLYPNPASEFVTIEAEGLEFVRLLNSSFTVILEEKTSKSEAKLSLSGIEKGVYHLFVETSGYKSVKTLVVK